MKPYTELTPYILNGLNPDIVTSKKGKREIEYLNIASAFDIETTSEYQQDEKVAHMYIWMFGIGFNQPVFFGRTWAEFSDLVDVLTSTYQINLDRRLVIYVHNLGYEFQFMKSLFEWESVFAISKHNPLKAVTTSGIEFRCSYKLSGSSLSQVAKNLMGEYSCAKMEGDLDYSLTRHSETPMTEKEMGYCENDIVVVVNYITKEIKAAGGVHKIEMTNTGRVRTRIKKAFLFGGEESAKKAGTTYKRAQILMQELQMTPEVYKQCKNTFQGGFTHSNPKRTQALYENVTSYDLTSSYPTVMCAEKFPMGAPKHIIINTVEDVKRAMNKFCVMFEVKFTGLRNKLGFESYFSVHKCLVKGNRHEANGRIFSADELVTYITDIDLLIAMNVYSWDAVEFKHAKAFRKGYLPRAIINEILVMYKDKTELKGVEGREDDYMLSKGMLNSTYGMCVTDPVKDEHTYDNEDWTCEQANVIEKIKNYNESRSRALYYPWGIWVTAYARRNLWLAILNIKDDYIYADTDSVKFINHDEHKPFFEGYNRIITQKLEDMCEELDIDKAMLCPKTIKGKEAPLGVWDFEGVYNKFKTLGAKRYLVMKDGKYAITVAGLSKQNGLEYIKEIAGNDTDKIFAAFNDGLFIPADRTGKMTHTNVEGEKRFVCTDYMGNRYNVTTESGMHLEPASFDMSISENFIHFIETQAAGYTDSGEVSTL